MSHLGRNRGSAAKRTVLRLLRGYSVGRPPEPLTERTACSTFGAMTIFARRNIAGAAAAAAALTAALLCPPAVPAQEHEAHRHGGERLGRVVFPISCAPAARPRFEHAMAVLHSFWWEKAIVRSARCWRPTPPAPWRAGAGRSTRGATPSRAARRATASPPAPRLRARRVLPAGPRASADSSLRRARSTATRRPPPTAAGSGLRRHHGAAVSRLPRDVEVAIYHALSMVATAPRTDTTFARQRRGHRDSRPVVRPPSRSSRPGPLRHSCHRLAPARQPGIARGATLRAIAPSAPHAQHMPSHIFIRLGFWDEAIASNHTAYEVGVASRSGGRPLGRDAGRVPHAGLRGLRLSPAREDSAARAAAAEAPGWLDRQPGPGGVVQPDGDHGADPARDRGLVAAAAFPAPADSLFPVAAMLARFTRAMGAPRGRPDAARPEVAALDSMASRLEARR